MAKRGSKGFRTGLLKQVRAGGVRNLAWSPTGEWLAYSTQDGTIHFWPPPALPEFRAGDVTCMAWSPDGSLLACGDDDGTIMLYQPDKSPRTLRSSEGAITALAWSPDGRTLASISGSSLILCWSVGSASLRMTLREDNQSAAGLAWSPDSRYLAWGTRAGTVRFWDEQERRYQTARTEHSGQVGAVIWAPDGQTLISGGHDTTISIWNLRQQAVTARLEGHTDSITSLSLSEGGQLLASASRDRTIRLWHMASYQTLHVMNAKRATEQSPQAEFRPGLPSLAVQMGEALDLWTFELEALLHPKENKPTAYMSAKVVLLGDSGVGKTGLAIRLSEQRYQETEADLGVHIRTLIREQVDQGDRTEVREILLWGLPGQRWYHLLPTPWLDGASVVLVACDAYDQRALSESLRFWNRQIEQATRGSGALPPLRYLVCTRVDRGSPSIPVEQLARIVDEFNFDGFFLTSAKTDFGISSLRNALRRSIAWERQPAFIMPHVLFQMREWILRQKDSGRLLIEETELFREYRSTLGKGKPDLTRESFAAALGHLERLWLVHRTSGLVLLQPEMLNTIAAEIVTAAAKEPHGLGYIRESALHEHLVLRTRHQADEERLLRIVIDELVQRDNAIREVSEDAAYLIFPTLLQQLHPDLSTIPTRSLVFRLDGSLSRAYATLLVKLSLSPWFSKKELWRNAATFSSREGGTCGIFLQELEGETGELSVFFDPVATQETRARFESFVQAHLKQHIAPERLRETRLVACPVCGEPVTESQARHRLERGFSDITCSVCETRFSLVSPTEAATAAPEESHAAPRNRVFISYNIKDRAAVLPVADRLREQGVQPYIDVWDLRPGAKWEKELRRALEQSRTIAVFLGANGLGSWQRAETESALRMKVREGARIIPVLLPGADPKQLPEYLRQFHWVDFREGEDTALKRLVWGIKAEPSESSNEETRAATENSSDRRVLTAAIGDPGLREFQQVGAAIVRLMGAHGASMLTDPHFDDGALWKLFLPNMGLAFRTQQALLFVRREELTPEASNHLAKIATASGAELLIVADLLSLKRPARQAERPTLWLPPRALHEMVDTQESEIRGWLGRQVTANAELQELELRKLLPYQTRGEARSFFGRVNELAQLLDEDRRGGILLGAHQSGKTSLLAELARRLRERGRVVVGTIPISGIEDFYETTLEKLGIEFPSSLTLQTWAAAVKRHCAQKQIKPAFLLDEVDEMVEEDLQTGSKLGWQLRNLQQRGICEFFLAGHVRLRNALKVEGGPYRNFAEEFFLTGLELDAALELVQAPIKQIGFEISRKQALRIIHGTARVPVLLQEFCMRLLLGRSRNTAPGFSDEAISVIEQMPAFLQSVYDYFQYGLKEQSASEAILLITYHREQITRAELTGEFKRRGVSLAAARLEQALGFLTAFGVLEEASNGMFRIKASYLKDAIRARNPEHLLEEALLLEQKGVVP